MITLEQARERVGSEVTYLPPGECRCGAEDGVITSVGSGVVYVRYGDDSGSRATDPAALEFLAPHAGGA